MARARPTPPRVPGAPPDGLRASELVVDGMPMIVFSYPTPEADDDGLTAAELEIARLLLAGRTNAEIARLRGTTPRTISKQIDAVYKKLKVHSRAELAARLG